MRRPDPVNTNIQHKVKDAAHVRPKLSRSPFFSEVDNKPHHWLRKCAAAHHLSSFVKRFTCELPCVPLLQLLSEGTGCTWRASKDKRWTQCQQLCAVGEVTGFCERPGGRIERGFEARVRSTPMKFNSQKALSTIAGTPPRHLVRVRSRHVHSRCRCFNEVGGWTPPQAVDNSKLLSCLRSYNEKCRSNSCSQTFPFNPWFLIHDLMRTALAL